MSKQAEIQKLLGLLESLTVKEIRQLRKRLTKRRPKINIPRAELEKLVKQNKSTKAIAHFYKCSPRTITRRIKEDNLTDIRPKGRKPTPKTPKKPKVRDEWVSTRRYINKLNQTFSFVNIKQPPKKWINPDTLVASDHKGNPEGEFTTVGIYYIAQQSNVYLLYATSIRYKEEPVPFDVIYNWIYPRVYDIVVENAPKDVFVVDIVALTFEKTVDKPEKIEVRQ